jgi:hypothetical protein
MGLASRHKTKVKNVKQIVRKERGSWGKLGAGEGIA